MNKSNSGNKRKRGRPATGRDRTFAFRLPPDLVAGLDAWAREQPDRPCRSEALRRAVSRGICAPRERRPPRPEWEDFEAASRRTIRQHINNSFIRTYKPVLDDATYRSFATMADYRKWCAENLPEWLGYG
jgi:hypothetical protein